MDVYYADGTSTRDARDRSLIRMDVRGGRRRRRTAAERGTEERSISWTNHCSDARRRCARRRPRTSHRRRMTAVRAAMRWRRRRRRRLRWARAPSLKLKLARQDAQKVVTVVNYKVTSNIKFRLLLCECVSGFAASARAWVIDRVWCWRSARGVSHDVWRRDARAWRCVRVGGTVYRECAVLVGETRD